MSGTSRGVRWLSLNLPQPSSQPSWGVRWLSLNLPNLPQPSLNLPNLPQPSLNLPRRPKRVLSRLQTEPAGASVPNRHLNTGPECSPGNACEAQTTNACGGRPRTPTTGLRVFVALSAALLDVIGDRVEVSKGLRRDLNAKSHAWARSFCSASSRGIPITGRR